MSGYEAIELINLIPLSIKDERLAKEKQATIDAYFDIYGIHLED